MHTKPGNDTVPNRYLQSRLYYGVARINRSIYLTMAQINLLNGTFKCLRSPVHRWIIVIDEWVSHLN